MRSIVRLLGGLLAIAVVLAAVEILHPKGLTGLLAEFTGTKPAAAPEPAAPAAGPAAPVKPAAPSAPVESWGPGATQELAWADRDHDRGDFDGAIANYSAARVLAANADERTRALRGLEKTLLAWGLVRGAAKVPGKAADLDAEYQRRLAPTEKLHEETSWLELARWTAGAGLRDRLPYVCGQTLDCARAGGVVQKQLEETASQAGTKKDLLLGAMAGRGFAKGPSLSAAPAAAAAASGIRTEPATAPASSSGIGGVNERGIPFGRFSAATREKLREAIQWERHGTTAYEAAGPDSPNRVENRHTALRLLKQARDVYLEAQTEDSESRDLDDRLKKVLMMVAQLKKDEGIGR